MCISHLQILRTIPFDKVKIKVISIHLNGYYDSDYQMYDSEYITRLINLTTQFLQSKSYRLEKIIEENYIYTYVDDSNDISRGMKRPAVKSNRRAGDI